jgi:hypothetical protein
MNRPERSPRRFCRRRRTSPVAILKGVGQNPHMVALTARGLDGTLQENKTYCYDLGFDVLVRITGVHPISGN